MEIGMFQNRRMCVCALRVHPFACYARTDNLDAGLNRQIGR